MPYDTCNDMISKQYTEEEETERERERERVAESKKNKKIEIPRHMYERKNFLF